MIEFDKLQWTEEPPRARGRVNYTKLGMRICVYDPPKRGAPHARLFVTDTEIAAVLRNRPVRFLTAWSEAHGTRAMAFVLCEASSYEFHNAPRGTSVSVAFGLFAWMNTAVAAYPIRQWSWDGERLIVLLPDGVQRDVEYAPQIVHSPNAMITHTAPLQLAPPVQAPVEPLAAIEAARVLEGYGAADNYPANPTADQMETAIAEGAAVYEALAAAPTVEAVRAVRGATEHVVVLDDHNFRAGTVRKSKAKPARRGAQIAPPEPNELDDTRPAARPLSKAEREAATVEIRRPGAKRQPVVLPPRVSARPDTDATRLQARCKFLQLDAALQTENTGATLTTVHGSVYLNPEYARVVQLMMRNVEQQHGATGLAELHRARFRAGDENRSLVPLAETAVWLTTITALLEKVGAAFRVESNLYALDALQTSP